MASSPEEDGPPKMGWDAAYFSGLGAAPRRSGMGNVTFCIAHPPWEDAAAEKE
jgi:hypothetical protein